MGAIYEKTLISHIDVFQSLIGGPIFRAKTQAVNGKIEEDKAECLVAVDTSTYHAIRLESNQIREWIDITKEEYEHLNYDITKVNRIDEPFRRFVVLKEN